jgi:predicted phage terminase large subunit-like protein
MARGSACLGPRASHLRGVPGADLPVFRQSFRQTRRPLDQAGKDRITVKLHLQSQPWHMYSGVIVRCILAASTLEGGKTAAKSVMAAVAAHREEFEFDRLWSGPNLAPHRQAVQEFITIRQGYRLATSTGGVLTGRGADIILIDDPLKPEEALSEAQRKATNEWYDHTLYSRLNDKYRGAIVIIMQRLHEDDLVGHVLGQEPWEVVSFPAIAKADEVHEIETIWGPRVFTRRPGEALHPTREPLATLDHIRRTMGEYNFAGQYQQSPAPLGGGLVKVEWFKRYRDHERPERFDRIVQSWDTANKATELSDFSVCTTWGVRGKDIVLLGVFRRRLEYPALKRAVREQQSLFNANEVLIEDKASGTQLIQELIADGCHGVTRYQPDCEKIMRLHAQTAMIENGFVHIPETAPWLAEYLHEMTVFPKGKHDDQVDSTAQFLDWFKKPFPGQYYRMQAKKPLRRTRTWVRLRAPSGVGAVQTFSGRHLNIGPDGTVEMSAEDAEYRIRAGWTKLAEWSREEAA